MKFLIAFVVICAFVGFASSLDCRKFSFAPACRGIMLKRASADLSEAARENQFEEAIASLIEEAEQYGLECISVDGLRKKLSSVGENAVKRSFSRFSSFA